MSNNLETSYDLPAQASEQDPHDYFSSHRVNETPQIAISNNRCETNQAIVIRNENTLDVHNNTRINYNAHIPKTRKLFCPCCYLNTEIALKINLVIFNVLVILAFLPLRAYMLSYMPLSFEAYESSISSLSCGIRMVYWIQTLFNVVIVAKIMTIYVFLSKLCHREDGSRCSDFLTSSNFCLEWILPFGFGFKVFWQLCGAVMLLDFGSSSDVIYDNINNSTDTTGNSQILQESPVEAESLSPPQPDIVSQTSLLLFGSFNHSPDIEYFLYLARATWWICLTIYITTIILFLIAIRLCSNARRVMVGINRYSQQQQQQRQQQRLTQGFTSHTQSHRNNSPAVASRILHNYTLRAQRPMAMNRAFVRGLKRKDINQLLQFKYNELLTKDLESDCKPRNTLLEDSKEIQQSSHVSLSSINRDESRDHAPHEARFTSCTALCLQEERSHQGSRLSSELGSTDCRYAFQDDDIPRSLNNYNTETRKLLNETSALPKLNDPTICQSSAVSPSSSPNSLSAIPMSIVEPPNVATALLTISKNNVKMDTMLSRENSDLPPSGLALHHDYLLKNLATDAIQEEPIVRSTTLQNNDDRPRRVHAGGCTLISGSSAAALEDVTGSDSVNTTNHAADSNNDIGNADNGHDETENHRELSSQRTWEIKFPYLAAYPKTYIFLLVMAYVLIAISDVTAAPECCIERVRGGSLDYHLNVAVYNLSSVYVCVSACLTYIKNLIWRIWVTLFACCYQAQRDSLIKADALKKRKKEEHLLRMKSMLQEVISIETACCICFTEYKQLDVLLLLPCPSRHYFHKHCVISWLDQHETCPLCRCDITLALQSLRNDY